MIFSHLTTAALTYEMWRQTAIPMKRKAPAAPARDNAARRAKLSGA